MKNVRGAKDRSISDIIGTLLLIAITVILMTTLGIFLFNNIPTGSAIAPQVDLKVTKDSLNYSNEYLISVTSVTENIPISSISLRFTVSGFPSAVMVPLDGGHFYYSYPILFHMNSYSGMGESIPMVYFNASIEIRLYIPEQFSLAYVNIVDTKVNAIVGNSPVEGVAISNPNLKSFPWIEQSLNYNSSSLPSNSSVNSTSIPGAVCSGLNIVQSYSTTSQLVEFNSNNFPRTGSGYAFWSNSTSSKPRYNSFDYPQLNTERVGKNLIGLKLSSDFFVNTTHKLNISLCTSEPVFLRIYNSTSVITPFNNATSKSYQKQDEATHFNATIVLHSGYYFVDIYYFYLAPNGIIAVNIPY